MSSARAILAIGALAASLAACGSPTHGEVIGKEARPPYVTQTMVCTAYIKGMCSVYVPIVEHHPESWVIVVKGDDDDRDTVSLPRSKWDRVEIGQTWSEGAS